MRIFTHEYKKIYTCVLLFHITVQSLSVYADTIVVTSEADSGPGTLRDAISNVSEGDLIVFAPNVQFIALQSSLPLLEQANEVTIDGLATNVLSQDIQLGDCNTIPSPIDSQELFSAAIRVTIDGSLIPNSTTQGIGLNIQTSNITIRGLRIQNFNGGVSSVNAFGILISIFEPDGESIIECCEIRNIISGTDGQPLVGSAFGIEGAVSVNKCLIQNIKTHSSLQQSPIMVSPCAGINDCKTVSNCVIKNIEQGGFLIQEAGSNPISIGTVAGISNQQSILANMTIEQCVIQNICGGPLAIATDKSIISLGSIGGILIDSTMSETVTIDDVTICTVNAGTIDITGSDSHIVTDPVGGIISKQNNENNKTSISNACITHITGHTATVAGNNNVLSNQRVFGITIETLQSSLYNNQINNITGSELTLKGTCNSAKFPSIDTLNCIPHIPFSVIGIHTLHNQESTILNNTIRNIGHASHTINGNKSNILSSGSAGIHAHNLMDSSTFVNNNQIESVIGPSYGFHSNSLYGIQLNGTTGIAVESLTTNVSDNTIQGIHEGSMHANSAALLTMYALPLNLAIPDIIPSETVPFLPVYTSGITVSGTQSSESVFTSNSIVIKNNAITDIQGSRVQGGNVSFGSYTSGITARPAASQVIEPAVEIAGRIEHNTISSLKAQSSAASYGIFVDGSNLLLELVFLNKKMPFFNSKFTIYSNSVTALQGISTITTTPIASSQLLDPLCGSELIPEETALIPFLPSEPTSGIVMLFGGLSTISDNTLWNIRAPLTRGITTVASSDMKIFGNAIFKTDGPGIFVGGATANETFINNSRLFTQEEFEQFFPSVRNKIYSNSTHTNAGEGIELGTINWNSFFLSAPFIQCSRQYTKAPLTKGGPVEMGVIGNHNQAAPRITRIVCNRNGTITIEATLADPRHPLSTFRIQFFRNNENDIPHGEQLISNFNDPQFTMATDVNGNARTIFTFTPAEKVTSSDIISAHVTLIVDGSIGTVGTEISEDSGDTSEFRMQLNKRNEPACYVQRHTITHQ